MPDLQRRRIESALADAGKIANDIDTANAALAEILDRVDDLLATLQAVRLGMIREAAIDAAIETLATLRHTPPADLTAEQQAEAFAQYRMAHTRDMDVDDLYTDDADLAPEQEAAADADSD